MIALVIGDIGLVGGMMHIGDEAMFEAARDALQARGIDAVGVSAEPAESAGRYGIAMLPRLGFAGLDRASSEARMRMLVAAAAGEADLAADDPATPVLAALDRIGGLVNAGGGNLASRWPVHVFERATLAAMVRARGLPVVVTGQTLGPDLEAADAALLRAFVGDAALVSAREPATRALLEEWGVADARMLVDDASFLALGDGDAGDDEDAVLVSASGWFDGRDRDACEGAIAAAVDLLVEQTGASAVFHPHFASTDPATIAGDAAGHERIRARMSHPSRVLPVGDAVAAARLARSARALVTSRYHPAVFAAPAGVPILAVHTDDYTRIKLDGALGHWDAPPSVSIDELLRGGAAAAADGVLAAAPESRAAAARLRPLHARDTAQWWDAVAAVMREARAS